MEAIGLSFIDWVIIIIYFSFVLGIGMYLRKYTLNRCFQMVWPLKLPPCVPSHETSIEGAGIL